MKAIRIISLALVLTGAAALGGCGADTPNAGSSQGAAAAQRVAPGAHATLALLETTDLHANVRGYDYYKLADDPTYGFDRVATLIRQARAEFPNTMLLDDGDTIQGTPLSDYQALVQPVTCDQTVAIYKVMNLLGYDGGGIGNHEFNYGLPYLSQVTGNTFNAAGMPEPSAHKKCAGPNFPQVLANVMSAKSKTPLFKPYTTITREITATTSDGRTMHAPLRVGIIGFTPPRIMVWDKRHLENRVYTQGVKETAEQYIPEMRTKGADLVVVISHSGLDSSTYSPTMEHGNYYLAQVPGVDALLMGHSHQVFPNASSTVPQFNLPNVDKVRGTVYGVPAVMAGMWGNTLGVIKFELNWNGQAWVVDKTKTVVEARSARKPDQTYVDPDPTVAAAIAVEHNEAVAYVKTPVGSTDFRMTTYFADVGEPTAIEIVNQAQADYVAAYVKANMPEYATLPVLSISAPFKSGFGGANDFTDIAAGDLAINNAADLYLYPNTVHAVKVNGAGIKVWLETAARRFNQINPAKTEDQTLISNVPGYNFDMFTSPDIQYEIDVRQPTNRRIKNLTYKGQPISPTQDFIVATNNYRASGGGNVPVLDGGATIFQSPDTNREVLIAYVKSLKRLTRQANGSHRSWRFTKVAMAGNVIFLSAQNRLTDAQAAGLTNISVLRPDDGGGKGMAVYRIDLSR